MAVSGIKVTGMLISSLLTTPFDITILADIIIDDSNPLKFGEVNSITATI